MTETIVSMLICSCLGVTAVLASEAGPHILDYRIAEKNEHIIEDLDRHLRVSQSCQLPEHKGYRCRAYEALARASVKELSRNASFGLQICLKLRGRPATGVIAEVNEDGFCRFPDGSYVGIGSLEYYGIMNDRRSPGR